MDDDVEELFHLLRTQTPLDDYRARSLARWTVACGLPWEKALRVASSGVTGLIATKFMAQWDQEQEQRLQAAVMNAMMSAYIMTDEVDDFRKPAEHLTAGVDIATDRFEVAFVWPSSIGRIMAAIGARQQGKTVDALARMGDALSPMSDAADRTAEAINEFIIIPMKRAYGLDDEPRLPPLAYHDKFNGHPRSPKASRNARKRGKR